MGPQTSGRRLALIRVVPGGLEDWRLAAGGWQLATGDWRLATGNWQLATGNWQLALGNWPVATGNFAKKIKNQNVNEVGRRASKINIS